MLLADTGRVPSHNNDRTGPCSDSDVCSGEEVGFPGPNDPRSSYSKAVVGSHRLHGDCQALGFESQLFGPIVWSVMQIPAIMFGHKARQVLDKEIAKEGGVSASRYLFSLNPNNAQYVLELTALSRLESDICVAE